MKDLFEYYFNRIIYAGVGKADFKKIRKLIDAENRANMIFTLITLLVVMGVVLLYSFITGSFAYNRPIYIVGVCTSSILLAIIFIIGKKKEAVIRGLVIIMEIYLMMAGLVNMLILSPNKSTTMIIAFMLIVAMAYSDPPYIFVPLLLVTFAISMIIGKGLDYMEGYPLHVIDLMVYVVLAIAFGMNVRCIKYQRFLYAKAQEEMIEKENTFALTDSMTGLPNSRAFLEKEKMLSEAMPLEFSIIMMDINGLKKANDTYGHAAGDELIDNTSEALKELFEGKGALYRLHGDEFACLIERNIDIELLFSKWDEISKKYTCKNGVPISVSFGIVTRKEYMESSIEDLMRMADERMYESKDKYYLDNHLERRRR